MVVPTRREAGAWLAATMLGLLLATAAAENKFSYPNADGLTFYQGDSITIEYVTDYASPKLHIFCYNDEGEGILDKLETAVKSGQGGATVAIDLSGVKSCWFNIQTQGNIWGFNSPIWTFAQNRPQDVTTSSSSSSATSAQTTTISKPSSASTVALTQGSASSGSTTKSTNTPASPTDLGSTNSSSTINNGGSSSSDTSTSEAGLSTAAKAGIGAGVGVSAALAMAALIFFLMARRRGASAGNASELPASRDDLGPSASSGPPPPQQQQQEVKSGWGLAGEPLPGQQQQQYHHADPAQYVGSGPYELYSGPHGPELPSHERPQEMPSFSTVPHGAQQGGKW